MNKKYFKDNDKADRSTAVKIMLAKCSDVKPRGM